MTKEFHEREINTNIINI